MEEILEEFNVNIKNLKKKKIFVKNEYDKMCKQIL